MQWFKLFICKISPGGTVALQNDISLEWYKFFSPTFQLQPLFSDFGWYLDSIVERKRKRKNMKKIKNWGRSKLKRKEGILYGRWNYHCFYFFDIWMNLLTFNSYDLIFVLLQFPGWWKCEFKWTITRSPWGF